MKYFTTILAILITVFSSVGQNLVINGNMEEDSCNISWDGRTGWGKHLSPDLIHVGCQTWSNLDYTKPYSGRACYGISNGGYDWHPSTDTFPHREYLIGKLNNSLTEGKDYYIKYMVKPGHPWDDPQSALTTDRISLAFISSLTEIPVIETKLDYILDLEPDIINPHGILYDFDNYVAIDGCYTASGDESYFVLGNFLPWRAEALDTLWKDRSTIPFDEPTILYNLAYVLIDNVEVLEVPELAIKDMLLCEEDLATLYFHSFDFDSIYLNGVSLVDSIVLEKSGTYTIEAFFGSCYEITDFDVEYVQCSGCNFYIPNIISQSDSEINAKTLIGSTCNYTIELATIYDRWGSVIYQSDDNFDWDGTLYNRPVEPGVYLYDIRLTISPDIIPVTKRLLGSITVF